MELRASAFFNTHVAWVSGFIADPNTDEFMQLVGLHLQGVGTGCLTEVLAPYKG